MKAKAKDFLSNLPDDILHHIFSFLGDNNVVRLQSLSRRFQTICFTSPSLCLSYLPPRSFTFRCSSRNCSCKPMFNFMNSVLQHRSRALKINKLSFSSFCKRSRHRKLHKHWIRELFQAFLVDEFSIHSELPTVFQLLPRFQSLKVLKLAMYTNRVTVRLPKMIKLASLQTLHMRCIITNDPIDEWVSQSFPSLKHLSLRSVGMEEDYMETIQGFTIRSSCLEDLAIHYCCRYETVRVITENLRSLSYACLLALCCHTSYGYEHSFEISAPLLQSLTLKGFPEQLRCEGTFKNLNLATVTEVRDYSSKLNSFIQLKKALRWGRILHTDVRVPEGLYRIREATLSFENISHVQIRVVKPFREFVLGDVASNFFGRLPNLETLTLMNDRPSSLRSKEVHKFDEYVVRECRRDDWREIKVKRLKKVEFIIRDMANPMAFLIGALKKWCVHLEEMILNYPPRHHESMLRYLESFEMMSNYAPLSINFLPDD